MTLACLTSFFKYRIPFVSTNIRSISHSLISNAKFLTLEPTMDSGHVTVSYVTTPNDEVARKLAKQLVEKRLAACINIVKTVESIYEWKGVIEHDQESMMIIKSHSNKTNDLIEFVEKNHPYDCPEVITLKLDSGSKKYLDWVQKTINEPRTGN